MGEMKESNKKHIAMYIGSLQKGGAERVMVNLAEYLNKEGYRVTFVTTYMAADEYIVKDRAWELVSDDYNESEMDDVCHPLLQDDEKKKIRVVSNYYLNHEMKADDSENSKIYRVFSGLPNKYGRVISFKARFDKLRNIWKELNPDIILSFMGKNNVMALATAKDLGIPVLVSVRALPRLEYESLPLRIAMRYYFPKAAGVILQTRGAKSFFPKKIQEKSVILKNFINPDFIGKTYTGKRNKRIVCVGRIDENKNQEMLIKAFSVISPIFPAVDLYIYGDGPLRKDLEMQVKNRNLGGRIKFMGNVDNIADEIREAKLFVLPSKTEGMPNALIEAMCLGIPCLATACDYGPSEIIKDRKTGVLVEEGNINELVYMLAVALNDYEKTYLMGFHGSRIQEEYKPEVVGGQWKDYIESILRKYEQQ